MNQKEFEMEMFDCSVRRLQNGHKLRLVLETSDDLDLEKDLIEFRGDDVNIIVTQNVEPDNPTDRVTVKTTFEVFDVKHRRLRNGDKLSLILEKMYNKTEELALVRLRGEDLSIFIERLTGDLPGISNNEEDNEDYEVQDVEK